MQVVGGRTNVWGRQSYRFSELDFKAASHDGFGEDWPLAYDDLAPYYDIVEDYVGITGIAEGVYELPDSKFHPPMGMRCVERHVRQQVKKKLGWTVTLGRAANITKPINGPPALPLLRALRARLRDEVVLQLRLHHRGRRARDRQLHARAERDGLQGADGPGARTRRRACSTSTA